MNPFPSVHTGRTASPRFPFTLPGVLLIVASYALIHALTRLLSSGNLGEDDTFDNLLIQTLAPGYSPHTGPLYDWLLWLLQQFLGAGIHAFLLLKYSLLVGMAGYIFLITRRLTGSPLWAFIAVESMATVYQIFWRFHEGFTHRVGAMVLAVATFWALLRLLDQASWGNRLRFATLVGLGLLSEQTYAAFLFSLLAATALQPTARRRIFCWPTLATLPLVGLILAPYLGWLLADPVRIPALLSVFYPFHPVHTLANLWSSLRDALTLPFLALSPYVAIAPLAIPGLLKSVFKATPLRVTASAEPDFRLLLSHLLLIEFIGLVGAGLLFSRTNYAIHSILPMFIIAIVWLTDKIRATEPSPARIKAFMSILLAFTITAYAMRSGNLFVHEPFCSRCRWAIPYEDLASKLRGMGFEQGTLVTDDERTSGNLRRFFPKAYLTATDRDLPPLIAHADGKLALVWAPNGADQRIPDHLQKLLPPALANSRPEIIDAPWQHLGKPTGYRISTWAAIVVDLPDKLPPGR